MVYIREVIVTLQQEEHVRTKHRVTTDEIEQVCYSAPWVLRGRGGSYAVYGQTDAGRYLVVYLYSRGHGIFSLATARDMNEAERRRYQRSR